MSLPLCIDLDGTLIDHDVTLIAYGDYICGRQMRMLQVLYWLIKGGRALVKKNLADYIDINPEEMMYHEKFIDFVKEEKAKERKIYLVTACNEKYANVMAKYLGIFDGVFASNIDTNLRAEAKANKLVKEFGEKKFAYAGNSKDDLKVWEHAGEIIVVNPSKGVLENLQGKEYTLFE